MARAGQRRLLIAIALAAAAAGPAPARADEPADAPAPRLTFYPAPPRDGRWAVGGVWQISPMFTASYRRAIDDGFAFDARVQTILAYNQLGGGISWAARAGPFVLGPTLHLDGYFGTLGTAFTDSETTGFDATGWGLLVEPGAAVGLPVTSDAWLTLLGELYLQPYQQQNLGGLVVSPSAPLWSGGRVSLVVEHATGGGAIYYGASGYHTTQNFPMWFNVNYSTARTWYLGFLGGYEF